MKIDFCQSVAESKPIVPDAGNAVGDRDASQVVTGIERFVPDAGDAIRDYDTGQAAAYFKRSVTNVGNAVGDRDASKLTARILDKRGLIFVEQDSIPTAVDRIKRIHCYCC